MNHPPIPISELAEHTELLKANDNLKLSQEYEVSDRSYEVQSFFTILIYFGLCFRQEGAEETHPSVSKFAACQYLVNFIIKLCVENSLHDQTQSI